jgi:hypothetical protein
MLLSVVKKKQKTITGRQPQGPWQRWWFSLYQDLRQVKYGLVLPYAIAKGKGIGFQ